MGTVSSCLQFWDRICSAQSYVPTWLRCGFPLKWAAGPPPAKRSANSRSALKESAFVGSSILELLTAGAVKRCDVCPRVVCPLSVVPKRNGKNRLILDMRHVNAYLSVPSFKFERLLDSE